MGANTKFPKRISKVNVSHIGLRVPATLKARIERLSQKEYRMPDILRGAIEACVEEVERSDAECESDRVTLKAS